MSKKDQDPTPEPTPEPTPALPNDIEVDGVKYTPEQLRVAIEAGQNRDKWVAELNKKGETVNAVLREAQTLKTLKDAGLDPDQYLQQAKAQKTKKGILPKPEDYVEMADGNTRYATDVRQTLEDFAQNTSQTVDSMQKTIAQQQLLLLKNVGTANVREFMLDNNLDRKTANEIIKFAEENGLFENWGTPERPNLIPDRAGLDAAMQQIQLNSLRGAARSGDPLGAQRSFKRLLGEGSKLDFSFVPTPSRAGVTTEQDVQGIVDKLKEGGVLTARDVETLGSMKDNKGNPLYYIPSDFPRLK